MKDFYHILGTSTTSTPVEIGEAYRKLSAKFHPEQNPDDSYFATRFHEVREAYEVLSDPEKRSHYDKALRKTRPLSSYEKRRIKRYYSRARGLNIALTLILIALAGVFGRYVLQSINNKKAAQAAAPVAATDSVASAPLPKTKHHRHKHWMSFVKTNPTAHHPKASPVAVAPSPVAPPVKAVAAISKTSFTPVKIAPQTAKARPDTVRSHPAPIRLASVHHVYTDAATSAPGRTDNSGYRSYADNSKSKSADYLYSTYIKANETGAVNVRQSNYFNSEIIGQIPGDAKITVLERGGMYYKVQYNELTGYVPKWTIGEK